MILATAIVLSLASSIPSQSSPVTLVDQGYGDMYNLAFADAHGCFERWEGIHPDDPIAPVSDAAAYLFSEFDRLQILQSEFFVDNKSFLRNRQLMPDPVVKREFDRALAQSQKLAEHKLKQFPNDEAALFATVLRLGLHADYLALIQKRYLDSLNDIKESRRLAERLLAADPNAYDAYLAIGVENYLLSLKPAPVRWMLRIRGAQTDRQTGLAKLRLTAQKGRYLQPYAELLLAVAALRDNDKKNAKRMLSELAVRFPRNGLYHEELKRLH
jgi:hypothetical protein